MRWRIHCACGAHNRAGAEGWIARAPVAACHLGGHSMLDPFVGRPWAGKLGIHLNYQDIVSA